jgi:hypothetical protein
MMREIASAVQALDEEIQGMPVHAQSSISFNPCECLSCNRRKRLMAEMNELKRAMKMEDCHA